jgi:hypothetical protein
VDDQSMAITTPGPVRTRECNGNLRHNAGDDLCRPVCALLSIEWNRLSPLRARDLIRRLFEDWASLSERTADRRCSAAILCAFCLAV